MAPVRVVVDSYDSYLHLCTAIHDDDDDDDGDDDNFDYLWKKINTSVGERLMTKIEFLSPPQGATCRSLELTEVCIFSALKK